MFVRDQRADDDRPGAITVTGFGVGELPVDFLAHHQRRGAAGGRDDFEQMLVALVSAVTGEDAFPVEANPGDWGIDVMVGDLNDSVRIWQAKYFVRGFRESQRKQVRESFESARRSADREGYRIEQWVLCVPCALDPPTLQWWQSWSRARQAETGLKIDLWDESGLRRRLDLPESAHVRRSYYGRPRAAEPDIAPVRPSAHPAPPVPVWRGGEELRFGGDRYLLHDEPEELRDRDASWTWREATADRIDPAPARVRLRQVSLTRETGAALAARDALRTQASLMAELDGARRLPRLLATYDTADTFTLVSSLHQGPSWREVFGPVEATPLGGLALAGLLAATARLCESLAELHRRGYGHRMLSPDAIIMPGGADEAVPRDLGLAGRPPRPGEGAGGYRAPEQVRSGPRLPAPGVHTDVYQIAAIFYHTVTGHPVAPGGSPPVRATVRGFPTALDDLLAQALDPDPERRPKKIGAVGTALTRARREIAREGFA